MHTRLEDLPAFELKQILTDSEPHLIGTFSHLRSVRAGRSWLYAGDHSLTHSDSNGWDHEHCEICQRTIGVGGERHAYINKTDRWLCERCYHDYAKPRSLGFLISA